MSKISYKCFIDGWGLVIWKVWRSCSHWDLRSFELPTQIGSKSGCLKWASGCTGGIHPQAKPHRHQSDGGSIFNHNGWHQVRLGKQSWLISKNDVLGDKQRSSPDQVLLVFIHGNVSYGWMVWGTVWVTCLSSLSRGILWHVFWHVPPPFIAHHNCRNLNLSNSDNIKHLAIFGPRALLNKPPNKPFLDGMFHTFAPH